MTTPARIKLPLLQTPFVDAGGVMNFEWARVLIQLFRLSGNSRITLADGVYLIEVSPNHIDAYSTADDSFIGTLALKNIPGPPAVPVDPGGVSGFTYGATTDGTLTVFGAKVEMQRDDEAFIPLSLTGGSFPMLVNDTARLTWFSSVAPTVFFWGTA